MDNNGTGLLDIERIVQLVMADLGGVKTPPAAVAASSTAVIPCGCGAVGSSSSVSVAEKQTGPTSAPDSSASKKDLGNNSLFRISGRVVTLDQIRQATTGTGVRRIVVPKGAVITPSAKDEIKKSGLDLVFDDLPLVSVASALAGSGSGAVEPVRNTGSEGGHLYTISSSNVPGFARQASFASVSRGGRATTAMTANPETAGRALGGIALAFHAMPIDTLPANLMGIIKQSAPVSVFSSQCVIETAEHLAGILAQTDKKGILLTHFGAIASAACNRKTQLRALIGYDQRQMESDAAALGANLLVLDPAGGLFRMRQMITKFLDAGPVSCPKIIRKGLEP